MYHPVPGESFTQHSTFSLPVVVVHSTLNTQNSTLSLLPPLKPCTFVNPPSERLAREGNLEGVAETIGEKWVLKRVKRG